jgi:hypothetical protein
VLCHSIVGPPWEMAVEFAALRAVVSSASESVLGHSAHDAFHVAVVGELAVKF